MSDAVPQAAPTFTPSELVVLFGEQFADEGGVLTAKVETLISGAKVHAEKLAYAAVAAAALAAETAGAIRLDHRRGKALFGLVKTEDVRVLPGTGSAAAFPEGTLERAFADAAPADKDVDTIVREVLGAESYNPPQRLVGLVHAGLAQRGLLGSEETKVLKVFTGSRFTLLPATRDAALAASVTEVKELLRGAEQGRPELWEAMRKEIRSAVVFMTQSND
jgi:hypothetical protein